MWVNLLKFAAVLFLNRKVTALKDNFFNLRHHVADYTEDRAQQLKQDFVEESERLATSIVGLLVQALVNQIVSSSTDAAYNYAGLANARLINGPEGVMYGPRSPRSGQLPRQPR